MKEINKRRKNKHTTFDKTPDFGQTLELMTNEISGGVVLVL